MYGKKPGQLYIYINKTAEILSYIIDARTTDEWSQFQANVYNANQIILEYNFTKNNHGGIAMDDIYISPNICSGNYLTNEILVNVNAGARISFDNNERILPMT